MKILMKKNLRHKYDIKNYEQSKFIENVLKENLILKKLNNDLMDYIWNRGEPWKEIYNELYFIKISKINEKGII